MTIDEAIKLIQADIDEQNVEWDSPLGIAYKLSFEALKRQKMIRGKKSTTLTYPLPGEVE